MKNLIALLVLIYSLNSFGVTIRDNDRYTTYIIPVNELVAKDKIEAINQSISILNEEIDTLLPKAVRSNLNKAAVEKLITYNKEHGEKLLEDFLIEKEPKLANSDCELKYDYQKELKKAIDGIIDELRICAFNLKFRNNKCFV